MSTKIALLKYIDKILVVRRNIDWCVNKYIDNIYIFKHQLFFKIVDTQNKYRLVCE